MNCNNCKTEDKIKHSQPVCYHSKLGLNVVQCPNCELVYLFPRPDKKVGLQYFEDAYSNSKGFEKLSYYRDHDQIFKRSSTRFEMILNLDSPNKKILDFGAGQGHFVKVAKDNGWESFGTELSEAARKSAKQNFQIELIENIDDLTINDFGVIALWDVIEHLEEPKEIIEKLSKYLHPNGYFVIETCNIDSLEYLATKKKWVYWHVDHLFYYSKKSLAYLFKSMGYDHIKSNTSSVKYKKSLKERFIKYIYLLNPKKILFILRVKLSSFKNKSFDKNSLMIEVFKKSN